MEVIDTTTMNEEDQDCVLSIAYFVSRLLIRQRNPRGNDECAAVCGEAGRRVHHFFETLNYPCDENGVPFKPSLH